MSDRSRRREAGNALPLLLLVLVLALGGLGYNYKRNLDLESQEARPYQSYADADLAALVEAYREQVDQLGSRGAYSTAGGSGGVSVGERVASYERIRRAGDANRQRASELAGQEGILRKLEREEQIRAERGSGWRMHLGRALRF